jgi:hypothetical protein
VLSNPSVDGLALRATWNVIETSDGSFNWAILDNSIASAKANHKKVLINIAAGHSAPSWLYAKGAKSFTFIWDKPWGPAFCTKVKIPIPWDPIFQQKWAEFVDAFGTKYNTNPTVVSVKLTGLNSTTDEVILPHTINESINNGQCFGLNDIADWQAVGYTRLKVEVAWQQISSDFDQAFPNKEFFGMHIRCGLPGIDDNGNAISGTTCDTIGNQDLIDADITTFGRGEYGAQNNGLTSSFIWSSIVNAAAFVDTGYQEKAPLGSGFSVAANLAIQNHAKFLEVYTQDLTNSSLQSAITAAHKSLLKQ